MLDNDGVAVTAKAHRILMIEDEPGIRSFASRALSAAGFAVDAAADGREGLAKARSEPPDMVLLDLGLPDLAGEDVLRRLRQERPDQAVLVWSAGADPDAERRCLLLGAHSCLRKPVPIDELLRSIGAPVRSAAHGGTFGPGLSQRHGHAPPTAGGRGADARGRQDAGSALRTEHRCLPEHGAAHPHFPPARGRADTRRLPVPLSRRVRAQHRGQNAGRRTGWEAS